MGLWLPLAMATLVQCVIGILAKPPARSELLESWALPELSKAVKRDEEEANRDRLTAWFDGMKARFGTNGG